MPDCRRKLKLNVCFCLFRVTKTDEEKKATAAVRGALSPHKAHIEYKSAAAATGKGTGPKEIRAQ